MPTELEAAAEAGDLTAQFQLALAHRTGDGVTQDHDLANRWYLRAATQGHPTAQYNLALALAQGAVIEQDLEQAFTWFQRAATNPEPDADAQHAVGLMLLEGIGTAPDVDRSLTFLNLAAEQDHPGALLSLARLFHEGTVVPADIESAANLAFKVAMSGHPGGMELLHTLGESGVAVAQFGLGVIHVTESAGFGVDLEQALAWTGKAHAQGYELASELFATLEQVHGQLLAVQQEAASGDPAAQVRLGDIYREGIPFLPADEALATEWFGKAAAQGHAEAQQRLETGTSFARTPTREE